MEPGRSWEEVQELRNAGRCVRCGGVARAWSGHGPRPAYCEACRLEERKGIRRREDARRRAQRAEARQALILAGGRVTTCQCCGAPFLSPGVTGRPLLRCYPCEELFLADADERYHDEVRRKRQIAKACRASVKRRFPPGPAALAARAKRAAMIARGGTSECQLCGTAIPRLRADGVPRTYCEECRILRFQERAVEAREARESARLTDCGGGDTLPGAGGGGRRAATAQGEER